MTFWASVRVALRAYREARDLRMDRAAQEQRLADKLRGVDEMRLRDRAETLRRQAWERRLAETWIAPGPESLQ